MSVTATQSVIPAPGGFAASPCTVAQSATAGIQNYSLSARCWMPAFAGMTMEKE